MDIGLLILRIAVGATLAAHGMQKLVPSTRGGMGIDATSSFVEGLGFRPARFHAWLLALAEIGAGLALAAGLGTPVAAAAVIGVMVAAMVTVHAGRGFFAQSGGIELPLLLALGAWALAFAGPGHWSLDRVLGWSLAGDDAGVAALVGGLVAAAVVVGLRTVRLPRLSGRRPAHA